MFFPTSVLDIIPGAGKAVSKTGDVIKLGIRAGDAAKVAAAEAKAAGKAEKVMLGANGTKTPSTTVWK